MRRLLASWFAMALLVGCGPGVGESAGENGSTERREAAAGSPTTEPLTSAELAGIASCTQLHEAVLANMELEAAAAGTVTHGDPVEDVLGEDPPELASRVHPPRPYGGLGGDDAVERYDQLGCQPDDEFPAILAWFGLPPHTPGDLDEGPLADAVSERAQAGGAEAIAAIALARRLTEGSETADSRLFAALRQVADAQEAYRGEHGRYADALDALVPYGVDDALTDYTTTEVMISVTAASDDAYCVHGADQGSAMLESHDRVPRNRAPGSPSCPHTFPDIDG